MSTQPELTRILADFSAGLRLATLPAEVVTRTRFLVLDLVGNMVRARHDAESTPALLAAARPMSVTFHRAFDWAIDPMEALETIISLGCERILTSGQQPVAIQGADLLKELIRQA